MSVKPDVIVEALGAITKVLGVDELMFHSYADGIPLTQHQASAINRMTMETVANRGFYTMVNKTRGRGTVFTFYDRDGEVTDCVNLNFPMISPDRRIPSVAVIQEHFRKVGYGPDRLEVKLIPKLIESHIRDGGIWQVQSDDQLLSFTLRMNDRVKARYDFYREDLTK